jgi:hypothetical protein
MARNLVLARCGKTSLHESWLAGAVHRSWDLALAPYQEIAVTQAPEFMLPVVPGLKWNGLHRVLTEWQGWRQYDYIWLPDDDLAADALRLNTMFGLAEAFGAKLAAPALSPDSYFSHYISMQNKSYFARGVSFVEVMMPCFRRDVLEQMLPLLAETATGEGWGFDFIWPKLLNYEDVYIFDCVTVRHTRPANGGRTPAQVEVLREDMHRLVVKHGASYMLKTLTCYKPDGRTLYAMAEHFLIDYFRGYEYLYEKDPAMFKLIFQLQTT